MDFKVNIKCNACSSFFELCGSYISDLNELKCPNCQQSFPQEWFEKLKVGMVNLSDTPESIGFDDKNIFSVKDTGFKLSVKEWSRIGFLNPK